MGPIWAPSFVAAAAVTTLVVPLLRRLALATGFVDRPGVHKSHGRPVPYLGGVGLIAGVLAGMAVSADLGPHMTVIALGAGVLGTVGLIDDHRTVRPDIRLLLQLLVASAPALLGLRVLVTGIVMVDAGITVLWIVGITNAFNLLDNMDGLSAGIAAAAASALLTLAVLGGEQRAAAVAAALVGACLGFLAYNRRPASIFMGDTGSLFLGFVTAVLAIEVDPVLAPPASFLVPLLVLALPMLDTSTVVVARLRRGLSVFQGGKDHLSHRLVALGLSPGQAVAVLVAAAVLLGAIAVVAGRSVIPVWLAVALAATVLATLAVVTGKASVYEEAAGRWQRPVMLGVGTCLSAVALLATLPVTDLTLTQQAGLRHTGASRPLSWLTLAAAVSVLTITLLTITRRRRQSFADHQ